MISNAILFFYDNDPDLKDYFKKCAINAQYLLNQKSIEQSLVENGQCNFAYIQECEFPKHENKSLLLIFSHGDADAFYKAKSTTPFMDHGTLTTFKGINGSLFYTNACFAGCSFGKNLVQKNAFFYGYDKEISIWFDYEKIFIECDNYGLSQLLDGQSLLGAYQNAKHFFTQKSDELLKIQGALAAADLLEARDSLVIHGDGSRTFF